MASKLILPQSIGVVVKGYNKRSLFFAIAQNKRSLLFAIAQNKHSLRFQPKVDKIAQIMPQTKSARKALTKSQKKRLINLSILKRLKTAIKNFKKRPVETSFNKVQSIADLAVKKRVIPKNRAARLKSNLVKILPKLGKTQGKRPLTMKAQASNLKKSKKQKA